MGALKQLAIRIDEEVDAMLDSIDIALDSPAYQEYHPLLADRLQRFVEREFLGGDFRTETDPIDWSIIIPKSIFEIKYKAALVHHYYREGKISDWALWRICSSDLLPRDVAEMVYKNLGFKPFAGYPLQKADELRTEES